MVEKSPVGKTKTQGWEIGVQRTLSLSAHEAWQLLMTQPGLGYWLGRGIEGTLHKGQSIKTSDGLIGEVRSYVEGSLIRLRWQPHDWDEPSTLQIRVKQSKKGAAISFHHEHLRDSAQRETMHKHWMSVIDQLKALIE